MTVNIVCQYWQYGRQIQVWLCCLGMILFSVHLCGHIIGMREHRLNTHHQGLNPSPTQECKGKKPSTLCGSAIWQSLATQQTCRDTHVSWTQRTALFQRYTFIIAWSMSVGFHMNSKAEIYNCSFRTNQIHTLWVDGRWTRSIWMKRMPELCVEV